ncbi:MAG: pyridoxal phosphate-dependent aminotransferase [Treponema sp.]|jgi:aspartate aminotransferase|nr:pyridoxal phosphate-dependent aminotransferase [Treponema sp.]
MPIANAIREALGSASLIRKMFEEGNLLKKQYGADKVFDFSIGNPDVEPPPAFHRVFIKLAEEDKQGSHGYMPNAGFPEVREALAQKVAREHQVTIDGSHIIMAVGAAGGLNVVFKAILNPGDEVIVPRPYFMEYRAYTGNHGGRLIEVDTLPDFSLDLAAIKAALSEKTAAVLINSPHNPTGRIYPATAIAELAALLKAHGNSAGRLPYLVADEPYREIAYNNITVPPILPAYPESLVVNSYSKSLSLPGERIGYIAVSPDMDHKDEVLNALIYATRILGFVNAPALMQRIVAELTYAKVDVDVYARRRDAFKQVLDAAGIRYVEPEGAFYLFCQAPGGNDGAFVERLKRHLILGVPGSGFGKPGWVRFAYCVDEKVIQASGDAFKLAME